MAAAIGIADEDGLAAVSIRRVAAALDARAMSLYTHIARKEDLLDLMADEVGRELLIEEPLPPDWRAAITAIATRERAVTHRHRWIVDLVSQHPRVGPNALRHLEQSLAAVDGLRLDPRSAARVLGAVDDYVRGCVVREIMELEAPRRRGFTESERDAVMKPYFQRIVDSGEFPRLAPLLEDGLSGDEESFDRGLNWLLDGIAAEHSGT